MRIEGIGNWVLLSMAAASLVSMIAAFSVYSIVSNDLYRYGLQFSYGWAISYWNAIGTIFAMAWFSIIAAIAFQVYRIIIIRREEAQIAYEQLEKKFKVRFGEKNGEPEYWNWEKTTEMAAVVHDVTQEEEEPIKIVPYERVAQEQIESRDSEQAE
jgi:hypothetical protein